MIINPYIYSGLDPDAQAFLTAAGITDATITTAINTLCLDLKSNNLWTKMIAVYPFVGGTATTHKWNLKDPQDTNAAFRLTFNGGVTHSSNGVVFDGVNAYANTYLSPSSNLTLNSNHISNYSRTSAQRVIQSFAIDMGQGLNVGGDDGIYLTIRRNTNACFYVATNPNSPNIISTTNLNGQGLYIGSTRANNDRKYFKNTTTLGTATATTNQVLTSSNIFIGAYSTGNSPFYYAEYNSAFATIGDGLNDTEATNFYNLIQTFQTTLSRQV